jgi:hypothetical protein
MLTRTSRLWALMAVVGFQLALSGCAQNVGDLDRTQPNRIDVSVLNDGKPWWFLQTVVGIPPASTFSFVGEASFPPDRIVWDVQENWLIGYRAYEWIVNSQTPYSATAHNNVIGGSNSPYFGTPVAAYAILSHFDIQREYNAQTGEQTNVISENTTDRPWYERQYVRVDWSNNALGAFNFMAATGGGTNTQTTTTIISPLAYFPDQEDPTNPDRTEVSSDYIGVVNKISYSAQTDNQLSQYYGYPVYTCFLWPEAFGIGDCGPGEVKVRLSFRKIADDHDFVPRVYTDNDVLKFGVWQAQHEVWDPERGFLEPNLAQASNAVMHHIWQKDHLANDPTTNQACDPNDTTNLNCIAPFNQRTPKPIVYYTSDSWPAYNDVRHSKMWVHANLLAADYNDDMRGVVAAALRGGPSSVENWAISPGSGADGGALVTRPDGGAIQPDAGPIQLVTGSVDYTRAPQDYADRYNKMTGLDYLAYPPDIRELDTNNFGMEGVRPNATYVDSNSQLCTASAVANGGCTKCDPTHQYCMGIGHVPYTVVPRMFVMCHNPVQPRKPAGVMVNGKPVDKSDSTQEPSFDFSMPGDPDICDPRPDSDRIANPLNPQMGDLRYHMLAWVDEPDQSAPGGIGEPAFDPVTGEIITSHAYIYSRAIELNATASADLIAVMNGWETYNDVISGAMVKDYVNAQMGKTPPQMSSQRMGQMLTSAAATNRIAMVKQQITAGLRDPAGGDWGRTNWQRMQNLLDPGLGLNWQAPPPSNEWATDFAPNYGANSDGQGIPAAVAQQISMGSFLAPQSITTWNSQYTSRDRIFADKHVLSEDEVAPVAMRLAKYYRDKFAANDPCSGSYAAGGGDYKTCIWETARQEILGNMWRSYSNHEVGHTFGQYHNFAGSSDALNYFDPYWALRQQNVMTVKVPSASDAVCWEGRTDPLNPSGVLNSNCAEMYYALGPVPNNQALAPEWLQAPSQQTLDLGMREYQYTSIMDYNAAFNSDFQGLGKYDHACHMYQYANMVEVFDATVLPKVPKNTDIGTDDQSSLRGQLLYPHETSDELRVPFNVHYTMYPWMINDGITSNHSTATQLPVAIEKMMHARRWVNVNDLLGQPVNPNETGSVADRNSGIADLSDYTQVPYRFCSDVYNQGEAHCLWFDSGADQYEQANGFIQEYNVNFMFRNFKRGIVNVTIGDNPFVPGGYYDRLWQRTFQPLSRIGQHWINDELIQRNGFSEPCPVDIGMNRFGNSHFTSPLCGLAGMAGAITVEDFLVKILQTPNTDNYVWDTSNNIYCGQTIGGGACVTNMPGVPEPGAPSQLQFQTGDSSKFDLSQFSQQLVGQYFLFRPTVVGYWADKMLAAQTVGDYNTYFVSPLNNQPESYLVSLNDYFFKDNQRAIGAWILDDPKVAPQVAVWATNATDPSHPPVSVYQNSNAMALAGGTVGQVNPWCPDNAPWCAQTGTTAAQYSPLGYKLLSYTDAKGATQPVRVDPSAVYFEKLLGLGVAIVDFATTTDDQKWIQTIRVNKVGDATSSAPAPLACESATGSPTSDIPTPDAALSCEDGTPCGAVNLVGTNCDDHSFCIRRNYVCAHGGVVTGTCLTTNGIVTTYDPTTCDPATFAYFNDGQNAYWAQKYVPQFGDLTDIFSGSQYSVPQSSTYYSANYEAVKLAASQQASAGSGGSTLSARQFLDIFRSYYFWYQYGTNPTDNVFPLPPNQ